jgi:hypothetical protein
VRAPVDSWFHELGERLANLTLDDLEPGATACIGLELAGHPGTGWVLRVAEGRVRLSRLEPGEPAEDPGVAPAATLVVRDDLAAQLVAGHIGVATALAEGGIHIRGDAGRLFAAEPVLAAVQRGLHGAPHSSSPGPSTQLQPEGGRRSQSHEGLHQSSEATGQSQDGETRGAGGELR